MPTDRDDAAETLVPNPEALALFGACLAVTPSLVRLTETRLKLLAGGVKPVFAIADSVRVGPALAEALSRSTVLPGVPARVGPHGEATPAAAVAERLARHSADRLAFSTHLGAIVAALNRHGVEPVLIKGARALWLGEPSWRTQRDLDLLLPASVVNAAQAVLLGMGYAPLAEAPARPLHHHAIPLFHPTLPGWVELHRLAGNHYAEQLLPTAELVGRSARSRDDRGSVLLFSNADDVLHSMIHHHVGHSGYARGVIDLKGLYEFAAAVVQLDPGERVAIAARATGHPRLPAILDLWIAAAADLFALPVAAPFAVAPDAAARWQRTKARMTSRPTLRWRYPGYGEEIAMAANAERLRRQPGGKDLAGRQRKRLAILASLLPRSPFAALRRAPRP